MLEGIVSGIDVLIITALELEYAAARDVALAKEDRALGVTQWEACDISTNAPYLRGSYIREDGTALRVALARPTRMGATSTLPVAAALVERLKPRCLAMCGVCAGNPSDVALGDVIIAEATYANFQYNGLLTEVGHEITRTDKSGSVHTGRDGERVGGGRAG